MGSANLRIFRIVHMPCGAMGKDMGGSERCARLGEQERGMGIKGEMRIAGARERGNGDAIGPRSAIVSWIHGGLGTIFEGEWGGQAGGGGGGLHAQH